MDKITKLEEIPQIDDDVPNTRETADSIVFQTDGEILWAIQTRILAYVSEVMVKMHGEKHKYDKPSDLALLRAIKVMKHNERHFRGKEKEYLDPAAVKPSDIDKLPVG